MYVGFTLWYLAAACWKNSLWPFLFLPIVLLVMLYGVILREERYLERRFGDEYRAYRQRVGAGSSSPPRVSSSIPRRFHAAWRRDVSRALPLAVLVAGLTGCDRRPAAGRGRRPVDPARQGLRRHPLQRPRPRSPPPTRRTCAPPGPSPPACSAATKASRWWSVPPCTW